MSLPKLPPPRSRFLVLLMAAALLAGLALVLNPTQPAEAQTSYCPAGTYQGPADPEVLVLTTPTKLPQLCARKGVEVFNNGPATIWCTTAAATYARVGRSRPIASGLGWSVDAKDTNSIWCVADGANQVAGAATILSELK